MTDRNTPGAESRTGSEASNSLQGGAFFGTGADHTAGGSSASDSAGEAPSESSGFGAGIDKGARNATRGSGDGESPGGATRWSSTDW